MTGVIHGRFTSGSLGGVRKEPPQQRQTSLTSSYLIFNKRQLLLGVGKFYIFFINCLHKHVENRKEEQELVKNLNIMQMETVPPGNMKESVSPKLTILHSTNNYDIRSKGGKSQVALLWSHHK